MTFNVEIVDIADPTDVLIGFESPSVPMMGDRISILGEDSSRVALGREWVIDRRPERGLVGVIVETREIVGE